MTEDISADDFYALIPAGGTGSRLWPLSRRDRPKYLLDPANQGRTLLQATFDRLAALTSPDHIVVSTGIHLVEQVRAQLPQLPAGNIIAELVAKDSAPAIALATAILTRKFGEHIIVGSFAADQVIQGELAFQHSVREAIATAKAGYMTTIGIAASRPSTAFGYIHEGESLAAQIPGAPDARKVLQFVEKPDAHTAQAYLATGEYRWNAGMFVMRADVLTHELRRHQPSMFEAISHIADHILEGKAAFEQAMATYWPRIEPIAFDYALAEPLSAAGGVAVVPGDFGWEDVGDFNSVAALLPGTDAHNLKILGESGEVIALDSAGDVVVPQGNRTVALFGVDDMVVVDTPDALLIAPRARSQEVKRMVDEVRRRGHDDLL